MALIFPPPEGAAPFQMSGVLFSRGTAHFCFRYLKTQLCNEYGDWVSHCWLTRVLYAPLAISRFAF